ncbi:hypothetical protein SAMN04489740_1566 [Arthrobacter alpinus]|uniref:HNH endonuclease n=1 Tax=Arthrobacter alpinus TaxID=656366 RepID=A0A1H5JB86_9MICC|nr:hypothetical protein [Arthrobacter alpinus]SEE49783.1 hypothetical protein SAMN04489740_1566 [Arthrobacter alpinus]
MSHLPALPLPGVPVTSSEPHAPESQLDAARQNLNDCGESPALLSKHQNSCAALAAVVIERFESAAQLEGNILAFDRWQRELTLRSIRAEIANILLIPESAASRLIEHATSIVRLLPNTLGHMSSGELGWECAVIIA